MSSYKTSQEIIVHRNRPFHFVSYEGRRGDATGQHPEVPAGWFLMAGGKRHKVMDQVVGIERADLLVQLTDWLDSNVFAGVVPAALTPAKPQAPRTERRRR